MWTWFFIAFYQPIANLLVFGMNLIHTNSFWISVLLLVLVVKIILFYTTYQMTYTQHVMYAMQDEVKHIQEKYKTDRQELTKQTMLLYKKYNISPFSAFINMAIQIPIFFGVYLVIADFSHNTFADHTLYSFVHLPEHIDFTLFGGYIDLLTNKNIIFALLVAGTQFLVLYIAKKMNPVPKNEGEFQMAMRKNMYVVLPVVVGVLAYSFSGAIAFYWIISNLLTALQTYVITKRLILLEAHTPKR